MVTQQDLVEKLDSFFDSYYLSIKNMNYDEDLLYIKFNEYLPFKSNDTPYNTYIKIFDVLIDNIKSSNMQNFYKISNRVKHVYSKRIEDEFIQIFFDKQFKIVNILLEAIDEKNFLNQQLKNQNNKVADLTIRLADYEKSKIIKFLHFIK